MCNVYGKMLSYYIKLCNMLQKHSEISYLCDTKPLSHRKCRKKQNPHIPLAGSHENHLCVYVSEMEKSISYQLWSMPALPLHLLITLFSTVLWCEGTTGSWWLGGLTRLFKVISICCFHCGTAVTITTWGELTEETMCLLADKTLLMTRCQTMFRLSSWNDYIL